MPRSRSRPASVEVVLNLTSGLRLVGFADAGHGLKSGQPAVASFDETGVVVAVTAS